MPICRQVKSRSRGASNRRFHAVSCSRWPLFRVSCLQKLRDFHQFSAQALISNAEVEFEELARFSLRDELTPIPRFGGLLRIDGGSFLAFQLVEEPCDRDGELHGNAVES